MLEKVFEIHPEVHKYSHSAYSQPSFLFYSVIQESNLVKGPSKEILSLQLCLRTSIQDLIDSLESKRSLWYLDDGKFSDDYRNVLKDLKKLLKLKERWDSKLKPRNVNFFSLVTSLKNDDRQY